MIFMKIRQAISLILMLTICSISMTIRAEQETIDWSADVDFDQLIQEFAARDDLATVCDNGTLKKQLKNIWEEERWEEIIKIEKRILNNCPIDIGTHISLENILRSLGKITSADHHLRWTNGIVGSIIKTRDGSTPQTAYESMILINESWIPKYSDLEIIFNEIIENNGKVIRKVYVSDKEENIKIIYFDESKYSDPSEIETKKSTDWSKEVNFDNIRDEYISKNIIHRCGPWSSHLRRLDAFLYKEKDWEERVNIYRSRLEACPVDIKAHNIIFYSLDILGRVEEADQHVRWYEGLMNSIIKSGDGKTPETAYRVIFVTEEYNFMWAKGLKPSSQSYVDTEYGAMDLFKVTDKDGGKKEIYFSLK